MIVFPSVTLAVTPKKQLGGSVRSIETLFPLTAPERRPALAPAKLVASTDQVPVSEDPICVSVIVTRAVAGPEMLLWSVPVQMPLRNASEGELGELSHPTATRQRPIKTAARTQIRRGRVIVGDRRAHTARGGCPRERDMGVRHEPVDCSVDRTVGFDVRAPAGAKW